MPAFIHSIRHSLLVRNIAIIIGGTAGAQLIALFASPVITRLYSPEAIGVLGSFIALLSVLLPIAAFSYPMAIVLPKKNRDAVKLASLSLSMVCIFSALILLVLLYLNESVGKYFGLDMTSSLFIPLSLACAVIMSTILTICSQWVIRHRLFTLSAQVMIAQALIVNGLKIFFGLFIPFGKTLIMLSLLGMFVHSALLFIWVKIKAKKRHRLRLGWGLDTNTAKEYKNFPLYRAPQGLLANVNQNLPVLLIMTLFGPIPAGLYTLCKSTLLIPVTLIAKSVNDVLFPQINEAYINAKAISPLVIKATLGLAVLALPPLIIFVLFGPQLFSFVFGANWGEAGILAQWLALRFYFGFINRGCLAAIPVLRLDRFLLINSIISLVLSIAGFYLGVFIFNHYVYAIALHSLFSIIPQILLVFSVILVAKRHDKSLIKPINS
ncbi:lipopolysaccharide biosynthesis protein [Thalassotalea ganghwensis]